MENKVKKMGIVICYFGKLPDYYKIWEYSCGKNQDIDFLLFTDQKIVSKYHNVKIINLNLEDMSKIISQKLKLKINIDKPYKLCDFRPAYGQIFAEYLTKYDFWGHCDLDQVFGNIRKFITEDILEKYDRIQDRGHLNLYRNVDKINTLYKKRGAIYNYKEVFTNNFNYAFDEFTGINRICERNKVKCYNKIKIADIDRRFSNYKLVGNINYELQIFYWEEGNLKRAYVLDNDIIEDEFCYLHFQKKNPNINIDLDTIPKAFYINKRGIEEKEYLKTPTFEKIEQLSMHTKKEENEEKRQYVLKRIKEFLIYTNKQKCIFIKQKLG